MGIGCRVHPEEGVQIDSAQLLRCVSQSLVGGVLYEWISGCGGERQQGGKRGFLDFYTNESALRASKPAATLPVMFAPLEFLYHFRDLLRERGVRFAITSGMAAVYYGLQQNTKDSDWIIDPDDLFKVHGLLADRVRRVPL